jgi:hypothetical protein
VPRFCWRGLAESAGRLVVSVVAGRRFQRLLHFTSRLGNVAAYLSGRKGYRIAEAGDTDGRRD